MGITAYFVGPLCKCPRNEYYCRVVTSSELEYGCKTCSLVLKVLLNKRNFIAIHTMIRDDHERLIRGSGGNPDVHGLIFHGIYAYFQHPFCKCQPAESVNYTYNFYKGDRSDSAPATLSIKCDCKMNHSIVVPDIELVLLSDPITADEKDAVPKTRVELLIEGSD